MAPGRRDHTGVMRIVSVDELTRHLSGLTLSAQTHDNRTPTPTTTPGRASSSPATWRCRGRDWSASTGPWSATSSTPSTRRRASRPVRGSPRRPASSARACASTRPCPMCRAGSRGAGAARAKSFPLTWSSCTARRHATGCSVWASRSTSCRRRSRAADGVRAGSSRSSTTRCPTPTATPRSPSRSSTSPSRSPGRCRRMRR